MYASVAIVQRVLPHYRVPFFDILQERLLASGIKLALYYGQEKSGTVPRSVVLDKPWTTRIQNRYFSIGATEFVWQPCLSELRKFDLVIIEQAGRLLINYALLLKRQWSEQKIAYWGHGSNLQLRGKNRWKDRIKRRQLGSVDWWFAYTAETMDYLVSEGVSVEQITAVNNTVDTSGLKCALNQIDVQATSTLRAKLGIGDNPVGLYCGGLYPEKRIDFLINACNVIKDRIPEFHMIIIGEGPESAIVKEASDVSDWLHYVGPIYGDDRASFLKIADVLLMPGAVGLVIVDSFIAETPLITTDVNTHGPEIAYLEPERNGVMAMNTVSSYAEAVIDALTEDRLQVLRSGCRNSAALYSLDRMVTNFTEGVVGCLSY